MSEFLVDTLTHKRWWLPDGQHQYNSVIYGDQLRVSVIDSYNGEMRLVAYIDLTKPDWENLSLLSQELARKRFPRDVLREAGNVRRARQFEQQQRDRGRRA